MVSVLVRCTEAERERIKIKAESAKLSVNSYLLKKGLDDGRVRDAEDSTTLADIYTQLMNLNQNLKAMPASEFQQEAGASLLRDAIAVCREVGREVVLYRLARQVERNS
ncbi:MULTISPECIES: plasmid mobilization protein [Leptolyngbya]|jgi:hypothetical protein|uniref:plasmid mobilization protein n=1 Tax=Leptolyngbya TaxID=47251 RepID=UPI00038282AE|nr:MULTISPECIES: hypothetical protein [Leptolyngbya]MBD2371088.1 hypothetical protein [Leptolyngbya sp. FACHB-161]MBD2377556.1 hypothetical protein [Leptolyngbya sp. FACHB-238]MBD2402009.1 hypothetical protein [Leptolyngbya sp. FACHB-239]MBD2408528.1 hypothetical protein [Leptolyngbya sp. FACHB-402]BAS60426.1 hypothetical protein LBWT_Y0140 [Leptolyngbya boryana IAM M-101]